MEKLNMILDQGIMKNASDIHLIAGCFPVLRIAKELNNLENIGILSEEDLFDFVREFSGNKEEIFEKVTKEKMLDTNYKFRNQRFRVNVSYSMDMPTCTLRIIKDELPRYETLNLPDIVRDLTLKSQGLILVTGKPGAGKSTTLNALVNEINERQSRKIMILENPIEFVHKNKKSIIVQKEVGLFGDCSTYHMGVKSALREDCDVLVIGEIRDKETMDATLELSETGHLVIGTLHTNSCAETIDRIINFYNLEEQQTVKQMIAAVIRLIVSQRMVRGTFGNLVMIPEILVISEQVSAIIKKEKYNSTEVEDVMLTSRDKGNSGLVFALAEAVVEGKITLDQAEKEVDLRNQDLLKKLVAQGSPRRYF